MTRSRLFAAFMSQPRENRKKPLGGDEKSPTRGRGSRRLIMMQILTWLTVDSWFALLGARKKLFAWSNSQVSLDLCVQSCNNCADIVTNSKSSVSVEVANKTKRNQISKFNLNYCTRIEFFFAVLFFSPIFSRAALFFQRTSECIQIRLER